MTRTEQTEAYIGFFGSEAGKLFLAELDRRIDDAHDGADDADEPLVSYGLSKGAKEIKGIKEHIETIMTPLRQGKSL